MAGTTANMMNAGNTGIYSAAPTTGQHIPPTEFNATEAPFRVLNGVREVIGRIGQDIASENITCNYWRRVN